jgi:hypothetical protein
MLQHLDDELGRQLWKQRRLAFHGQLGCGGSSGPGEESLEILREGGSFRGLLGAEEFRSGGALAGGGAESGKGGVGHGARGVFPKIKVLFSSPTRAPQLRTAMRVAAALVLAAGVACGHDAPEECCWCDDATPKSAQTIVGSDSQTYKLVFSDEFETERDFANGKDAKWTALDIGDTSNKGAAFYLSEQASVQLDEGYGVSALRILTERKNHTGDSPTGEKNIFMPYSSAMLQSWNKFCFTGGIVEFRARMPRGGGYWPALWAFGNLGRAVYQDSNTGLWPWSYNECSPDLALPPTDPPQRISACDDHDFDKEGLLPFQGRGATELDVLEGAVTNVGYGSYGVGSVQLSPGIPPFFRPPMFGFPTKTGAGSWYSGLKFGPDGKPNNGWYGPPWGSECLTGCPDALSAGITEVSRPKRACIHAPALHSLQSQTMGGTDRLGAPSA